MMGGFCMWINSVGFTALSEGEKMGKIGRLIPFGLALVLAIPVFRSLCEKFRTCQAIRAYTIISYSEPLFVGLA